MRSALLPFFVIALSLSIASCETVNKKTPRVPIAKSPLTHGNVQITLKKGITTQQEVIDTFGAPNIATVNAQGEEVWTYQKHATVQDSKTSGVYGTVILFGGSSRSSGFEESSRTMTLIIKFNNKKVVSDFKSMYSSF